METKNVKMPAGYEFSHIGANGEIIVKKIAPKYPINVDEIRNRNWYIDGSGEIDEIEKYYEKTQLSTKERAEAFLALMQLVELRDAWNEIDGFVANWSSGWKHCIDINSDKINHQLYYITQRVLYFGSDETARLFAKTFKDLIETAKELL
jgi:hypothetical protein